MTLFPYLRCLFILYLNYLFQLKSKPDVNNNSNNNCADLGSKKSVSFSKQVVRNVFKPGSTVVGMKKPGSSKNKKKNKRNRTVSDPSHDGPSLKDDSTSTQEAFNRNRSLSESSDDASSLMTNSNESLPEPTTTTTTQSEQAAATTVNKTSKNKKKKKKKLAKASTVVTESSSLMQANGEKSGSTFSMETMLQWKNQGIMPTHDVAHTTSSAIKLRNSVINDLDD